MHDLKMFMYFIFIFYKPWIYNKKAAHDQQISKFPVATFRNDNNYQIINIIYYEVIPQMHTTMSASCALRVYIGTFTAVVSGIVTECGPIENTGVCSFRRTNIVMTAVCWDVLLGIAISNATTVI